MNNVRYAIIEDAQSIAQINVAAWKEAYKGLLPEELLASTCAECGQKIEDVIKEKVATIGEKITVRRFVLVELCGSFEADNRIRLDHSQLDVE